MRASPPGQAHSGFQTLKTSPSSSAAIGVAPNYLKNHVHLYLHCLPSCAIPKLSHVSPGSYCVPDPQAHEQPHPVDCVSARNFGGVSVNSHAVYHTCVWASVPSLVKVQPSLFPPPSTQTLATSLHWLRPDLLKVPLPEEALRISYPSLISSKTSPALGSGLCLQVSVSLRREGRYFNAKM